MTAALRNNLKIVTYLIETCQFDLNKQNMNGWTTLMYAANNSIECVRYLIENGADKTIKNHENKTAYEIALEKGNLEIIALLK